MIRIVSDGTAHGTRIETASGEQVCNVLKIEVMPIEPGGTVNARLTVAMVALDLVAAEAMTVKALNRCAS